MKITIINGTNRTSNNTMNISNTLAEICKKRDLETYLVTLENFTTLFKGEYITINNATSEQAKDIKAITEAKMVIFVVPVYHHGIPSSLKNFLDIVSVPEMFANNVIGVISSNENSTDGARQTKEIVEGYISYNKAPQAYFIPDIPRVSYTNPDKARLEAYLDRMLDFTKGYENK